MQFRVFGRTGMQLSVLGFGCGRPPTASCTRPAVSTAAGILWRTTMIARLVAHFVRQLFGERPLRARQHRTFARFRLFDPKCNTDYVRCSQEGATLWQARFFVRESRQEYS
jgi:hypothetical protein